VFFQAVYDEIELLKIVMTLFQWPITISSLKNVTKITSQFFFPIWPLPIKISGYASVSWITFFTTIYPLIKLHFLFL